MKSARAFVLFASLLLLLGCAGTEFETGRQNQTGENFSSNLSNNISVENASNASSVQTPTENYSQAGNHSAQAKYTSYEDAKSFFIFTDPNEGAFSLEVPDGWAVSEGSGLIRPYIDAGVAFEAKSKSGQGFFFQDPYGYIYTTPNAVLNYTGFTEGSLYNPSGGVANPMMVKQYESAQDFVSGLVGKSGANATNTRVVERPDLLANASPLVSRQSAAELSFEYYYGGRRMESTIVARTTLMEVSETGVWSVSLMEYYAPAELMNETELLALNMQRSFKVNATWAARENEEVKKRLGILAQGQSDIAKTISSTFELRSRTMDELNEKWDQYILGVEDAYDPDTGQHYLVDSGSSYYWIDDRGSVYGTDTADSPLPRENLKLLTRPER